MYFNHSHSYCYWTRRTACLTDSPVSEGNKSGRASLPTPNQYASPAGTSATNHSVWRGTETDRTPENLTRAVFSVNCVERQHGWENVQTSPEDRSVMLKAEKYTVTVHWVMLMYSELNFSLLLKYISIVQPYTKSLSNKKDMFYIACHIFSLFKLKNAMLLLKRSSLFLWLATCSEWWFIKPWRGWRPPLQCGASMRNYFGRWMGPIQAVLDPELNHSPPFFLRVHVHSQEQPTSQQRAWLCFTRSYWFSLIHLLLVHLTSI